MPAIQMGTNAYRRDAARLPPVRLVNRYIEVGSDRRPILLPRPCLAASATVGDGPIRGFYCRAGVLDGDYLVVSASTLYRVTVGGVATSLGSIAGSGWVEIDSPGGDQVYLAAGTLYLYDGAALGTVATPDGVQITSLRAIAGFVLLQVADSGRFYWIQPGETTIDALDFATAERSPDNGVCIRLIGDLVGLWQTDGVEVWFLTGDADAPFQRQSGIVWEIGAASREATCNYDNGVVAVGAHSQEGLGVYRFGQGPPAKISEFAIDEALRGASALSAFVFYFDGHLFYVLRCEGVATYAYDASAPEGSRWCEFASYGLDNWLPQMAASAAGVPLLLGSSIDGKLYTLDPESGQDDGQPVQRVVTGRIPVEDRGVVNRIRLFASVGWSPSLSLTPKVNLRVARDGFTFGNPRERTFGARGEFGHRIMWDGCGEARAPALVVEFTDSDNAQVSIFGAEWS